MLADPTAHEICLEMAQESNYKHRLTPLLGRFSELPKLFSEMKIKPNSIDGFLFDFGCSSMQFDDGNRGFSIVKNAYLDMRMDKSRDPTQPSAADILARIDEDDLARALRIYGDEKYSKKIARAIVETRNAVKKIETTKELADIVFAATGGETRVDKLDRPSHVATKTFQALRILVNNELNEINYGIFLAHKYLKIGGRLVTITFHSLEDTIIKRHLIGNFVNEGENLLPLKFASHIMSQDEDNMKLLMESNWRQINKHVLVPRHEEVEMNARSRSAKFRAAVKIR